MFLKEPKAFSEFNRRNDELQALENIARDISRAKVSSLKTKKNIQRNVQLVFIVTIWETYVEELLLEVVEHICTECNDPLLIPGTVTNKICAQLAECKDQRQIWRISGDHWKQEYLRYCKEKIAGFNTPRSGNIDTLIQDCIGLKKVSDGWRWKGMSSTRATRKINDRITERGAIIHQLNRNTNLSFKSLKSFHTHLINCCHILADQLRDHVQSITGKSPWE